MSVYAHFGLRRSPFGIEADPDVFYAAPSHQEALATLQFVLREQKPCVAIVGESGLGKTFLARLLCRSVGTRRPVLWVPGLGQSERVTRATLWTNGHGAGTAQGGEDVTLGQWLRSSRRHGLSPRLIIDDADALGTRAWGEIMALLSREIDYREPLSVILLGLPALWDRLAQPDLARLRRRIFRICPLRALPPDQVRAYVARRIAAAGGDVDTVFSPAALEQVARVARGNPGLVNQVCDNAMIEACSADHRPVLASDVLSAVSAIIGMTEAPPELSGHTSSQLPCGTLVGAAPAVAALPRPLPPETAPAGSFETRMRRLQGRLDSAVRAMRAVQSQVETLQSDAVAVEPSALVGGANAGEPAVVADAARDQRAAAVAQALADAAS